MYTYKPRESWFNVIDDSKLIEPAKHYYDDYMQRTFRGWEDSGAYVKEMWTGSMLSSSESKIGQRVKADVLFSPGLLSRFRSTRRRNPQQARSIHLRGLQWTWDARDIRDHQGPC